MVGVCDGGDYDIGEDVVDDDFNGDEGDDLLVNGLSVEVLVRRG